MLGDDGLMNSKPQTYEHRRKWNRHRASGLCRQVPVSVWSDQSQTGFKPFLVGCIWKKLMTPITIFWSAATD